MGGGPQCGVVPRVSMKLPWYKRCPSSKVGAAGLKNETVSIDSSSNDVETFHTKGRTRYPDAFLGCITTTFELLVCLEVPGCCDDPSTIRMGIDCRGAPVSRQYFDYSHQIRLG